jgi:IS5 family transposase
MRQERTVQATIFEVFAGHEIGCELKAVSPWLDRQHALVRVAAGDLRRHGLRETGGRGPPAETVPRCALLKQQRQLSYEDDQCDPARDLSGGQSGGCWPAPDGTSWKAAPCCGSTAGSPQR